MRMRNRYKDLAKQLQKRANGSLNFFIYYVTVATGKCKMEGMSTKDVSLMLRDNGFPEETIENLKSEWAAAVDLKLKAYISISILYVH